MKHKNKKSVTLYEAYNYFPRKNELTRPEYTEILKTFNQLLFQSMADTGYIYKLPQRLGTISVRKRPTTGRAFSWPHYHKTGEKKYFKNKHSDGFYARYHWDKSKPYMLLRNSGIIKFVPTRNWKRYLATNIIEHNTIHKYFDHD